MTMHKEEHHDAIVLSIVVPTRNRARQLRDAIPWFQALHSDVPWELIFVDSGSTDETQSVLREISADFKPVMRIFHEAKKGVSAARNAGWRQARGSIVAFLDDDCYPDSGFIGAVMSAFEDPQVAYIGGRVLLFDPADAPMTLLERDTPLDLPPHVFYWANGVILGANMAARRSALESLGGFDEDLGAGTWTCAAEDIDIVSRAAAAGFTGLYTPAPIVFHHHRRKPGVEVSKLLRAYGIGRGAYFLKCCLDPARRRLGLKAWYWSIAADIKGSVAERRLRPALVHELIGAYRCAWKMLGHIFSGERSR